MKTIGQSSSGWLEFGFENKAAIDDESVYCRSQISETHNNISVLTVQVCSEPIFTSSRTRKTNNPAASNALTVSDFCNAVKLAGTAITACLTYRA